VKRNILISSAISAVLNLILAHTLFYLSMTLKINSGNIGRIVGIFMLFILPLVSSFIGFLILNKIETTKNGTFGFIYLLIMYILNFVLIFTTTVLPIPAP